jgi:hypothetical protein
VDNTCDGVVVTCQFHLTSAAVSFSLPPPFTQIFFPTCVFISAPLFLVYLFPRPALFSPLFGPSAADSFRAHFCTSRIFFRVPLSLIAPLPLAGVFSRALLVPCYSRRRFSRPSFPDFFSGSFVSCAPLPTAVVCYNNSLLPGSHLISFRDTRPSFISATFFCWYRSAPFPLAGVFSRAPLFRCFTGPSFLSTTFIFWYLFAPLPLAGFFSRAPLSPCLSGCPTAVVWFQGLPKLTSAAISFRAPLSPPPPFPFVITGCRFLFLRTSSHGRCLLTRAPPT